MSIRALLLYIRAKHREKTEYQSYVADMLWATASGRTFSDDKHNPTYPRWRDMTQPSKQEAPVTKESTKAQFARLKRKKKPV